MKDNFDTEWLKKQLDVKDFTRVEKIRSADQNKVVKIHTDKGTYILKEGPSLTSEKVHLAWLDGKLPVPNIVAWQEDKNKDKLLMTYIEGKDLASLSNEIPSEVLVNLLAQTLRIIHNLDISNCPFGKCGADRVFIHGDACLPNFIFDNGKLSGIVDLGNAGIGDKEDDLAAAIWSLDFNFGSGLGIPFLRAYGIEAPTTEDVERLRLKYENDWSSRFRSN